MTDQEYIREGARVQATRLTKQLAVIFQEFAEDETFPSVQTVDDAITAANNLREAILKYNTTQTYK